MLSLSNKLGLSTIKTGFDNYSLQFNGTDEFVEVDAVGNDMNTQLGTISFWCKLNDMSANAIALKAEKDSNNLIHFKWTNSQDEIRILYKAGGTGKRVDMGIDMEGDGDWHHIVLTWSKVGDAVKGYHNASQVGGTQSSLGTWDPGDTPSAVDIGRNTGAADYWSGKINNVAIFNQVISETYLYNGGKPLDLTGTAGLVGYWRFEEGSGTSAYDSSGKANTGTLNNTPTWSTDTP